jgi:hypothetical protein
MKLKIVTDPEKIAAEEKKDRRLTNAVNRAVHDAIKARFDQNKPVSRYDKELDKVYWLYCDGTKVYK